MNSPAENPGARLPHTATMSVAASLLSLLLKTPPECEKSHPLLNSLLWRTSCCSRPADKTRRRAHRVISLRAGLRPLRTAQLPVSRTEAALPAAAAQPVPPADRVRAAPPREAPVRVVPAA